MRLAVLATSLLLPATAGAASPTSEGFSIRGRPQSLHLYGPRGGPVALLASGDGGWVHLGPDVAEFLASRGFFVVGLDSKAYLSSFTRGETTLSMADVPLDFAALVSHAAEGGSGPPILVGVSEGAGLCVLAASDEAVKSRVAGVVALGLPDKNELGWRFRDSIIYVTKGVPREPLFSVAEVIAKLSPLPIAAIHSTRDEFAPVADVRRIMGRALEPKRLSLIPADDHRFSGSRPQLERALLEAIAWIGAARH